MLNETVTIIASANYFPVHFFYLLIAIGFVCLIAMKYYQDVEVLFGLASVISFGVAAYEAPYVYTSEISTILINATSGELKTVYTQIVQPQPVLQVFLAVLFLFALIMTLYVTFLRNADSVVDKTNLISEDGY